MTYRKSYRIEANLGVVSQDEGVLDRHSEVMGMLAVIKESIVPAKEISSSLLEEHRRDMQEALRLKAELDSIYEAIERTKREIATLRYAGAQGKEITRVTDELGAIVTGTETATNSILAAAERIDDLSSNLSSRLAGSDQDIAREILDHVISIFEACNFQDITGQRISKVVGAMKFVEERVHHMMEIWGGMESFKDIETIDDAKRQGEKALLNGPALAYDNGVTSQDAIDALFN
ncbi:protein phosphatase CheZ [Microvirga sp. CF3062]|uniref:protein phosphatase CheZ n=1 Tax=Microvirga sp. CF3062 TaxID=3110182 RepID=UPI002E78C21F|nr:protein phosphatase CheZ [Microvirga sp. CF3062]MEE1655350.1 protein phosphatase CheZ [Microvirga sp. CF3062]